MATPGFSAEASLYSSHAHYCGGSNLASQPIGLSAAPSSFDPRPFVENFETLYLLGGSGILSSVWNWQQLHFGFPSS
ncbi:MAG TPA: hypothetical protein VI455_00520 [Terriglobia bacterium]